MEKFHTSQHTEIPVTSRELGPLRLRYAYARSRETQLDGEAGQDYLSYLFKDGQLSFSICDGVSMSFCGQLASKYLGEELVSFMEKADCSGTEGAGMQRELQQVMKEITAPATEMINRYELPASIGGLFREVLEEKRRIGSETTFVCGRVRTASNQEDGGLELVLAWMGDTKIRLWQDAVERSDRLSGDFSKWNRWSTLKGSMGEGPFVYKTTLRPRGAASINRIQIYTDGLHAYDEWTRPPGDEELMQLVREAYASPDSDDLTFLELSW
ncbi:hypothetical protein DNH61_16515 [Paenibacillus sambharensis]|uniref:PPM-type phosphatase domain-containing protein n=1 Tax=Paenibacillus sambharensis TaxID=1803190 RepID=A0A2W1L8V5_9BACL|nr:hypothetical protein [Paenibacillus sambharensis]PZD94570.1 hypothetical protein DNH61_16515 [Paenibacillus sambharensis]